MCPYLEAKEPEMARYMFLLFGSEDWIDTANQDDWRQKLRSHQDFSAAVEAAGARVLSGDGLERAATATTVANPSDGGAPLITDGPFIETKEALGGFYVIECADLDHALELASICPAPKIEVRPVLRSSS
jgi:hypothetical protein